MRKLSDQLEVLIACVVAGLFLLALMWFRAFVQQPPDPEPVVRTYNELVGPQHCRGKAEVFDCMRGRNEN